MTDYTIASPNGGTWSIQSTNTAKTGRFHDLALLMEGASGVGNIFTRARPGFLTGPTNGTAFSQIPAVAAVAPTSGLGWNIQPFAAVVERTSSIGPYVVTSTAVGTGAVGTADPSQNRIDRLDLVVYDGLLGDDGGVSLTVVRVTPGTPGSGTPAAPNNSIPIGHWTIPPGTTTLLSGMWAPARKSAGLRGCVRLMLEGDSLFDPGFMTGELRDTSLLGGYSIDRWNPGAGVLGTWQRIADLSGAVAVEWTSFATITYAATTFAVPSAWTTPTPLGAVFTAPASGIVKLDYSARMHNAGAGGFALFCPVVKSGGTIGSGTSVISPANDISAQGTSQNTDESISTWTILTGLTPGAQYNAQMAVSASAAGGTASFSSSRLLATPIAA